MLCSSSRSPDADAFQCASINSRIFSSCIDMSPDMHQLPQLLAPWDKTRATSPYHQVIPLSGLDPIDLVKRLRWESRDIKILARTHCRLGGSEKCSTALNRPS